MHSPLVGRDRELAVLLECLSQARHGQTGIVVCVGAPGIGKTRLAEELTRLALTQDFTAVWGRAAATDDGPPYWPWREVLHALDEGGVATDEVAQLIESRDGEPAPDERMRRFDAVTRLLLGVAKEHSLVVVLDDLDGADKASQQLVRHLARSTHADRLVVLITCRDTSGPLATLAQEPNTTQLELRGLSRTAVAAQITDVAGRRPGTAELSAMYDATGGNPFFVGELARQLADGQAIPGAVPRSVLDAISQRLNRLSPTCAASLRAAAVLGTRFDLPVLATMTDQDVPGCLAALDEATRAGLVEAGPEPDDARFTHRLVRDAIAAGLDTATRVALHQRAARALEHHSPRPDMVVFDLAHHWSAAAVTGDRARAAEWTQRAGHEAMRLHAYEDARRWFARARALAAGLVDDESRCRLMISHARAQSLAGDFTEALGTCGDAIDHAIALGRPDLAAEAALVPEPTFDEGIDQVIRVQDERALAVLDHAETALRARVLAHYGWVCDHLSDLDAAHPAVEEALTLGEASGDTAALEAALVAHHMVRSGPDGLAEREANADRMCAIAAQADDAAAYLMAAEWRFDAASERGDLALAAREVETVARWAGRVGGPLSQWRLLRCRAMLAQARGQYADAHRLGAQALGAVAATGYPAAFLLWGGLLSVMSHHSGVTTETLATAGLTEADATEQDWPLTAVIPTLAPASLLAEAGRLREAAAIYRRLGPAVDWQESPHAMLFTWAMGLNTAMAVGADDDVATLRAKLGAWRGHHVVNGRYAMGYGGPAELHLGRAAAYLGLLDDAVADLEQALKACTENGAEGHRAEAGYELASTLALRSAPGDHARARSLLVEALRRMDELGMPPLRARARALLDAIDTTPGVALTRRELEVAGLVAEGLTNREIAARLVLSERTAQNHVQHILDKLDLRNRSQVTRWVQDRS